MRKEGAEKKQIGQEEEEVQRGRNFLIEYAERIRGAPKGFVPRSAEKEKLKKWPIFTHLSKPMEGSGGKRDSRLSLQVIRNQDLPPVGKIFIVLSEEKYESFCQC